MRTNNSKILILVGAPGSGKSTYAKYHVRTEDNWFRVCRDDFRLMQFTKGNLSKDEEIQLTKIVSHTIHGLLKLKINVIIDATNTRKEFLNGYIHEFGEKADISFKLFDLPLAELAERCENRKIETGKYIPSNVIKRQYSNLQKLIKSFDFSDRKLKKKKLSYAVQSKDLPKAIICDLDGTLCLMNGRNPFDASRCDEDLPNTPVVNMVKQYKGLGYTIILLSGRSDAYKPQTIKWLKENEIIYDDLVMRKEGDHRKDSIVKSEFYYGNIDGQYNVELVLDDRDQVVELWRETLGLPCFQVYYGDF